MLIVIVMLAAGFLPLGAAPAFACSCVSDEVRIHVRNADHVVVGRLLSREDGGAGEAGGGGTRAPIYGARAVYYTVQGEEVLKGSDVGPSFEVVSAADGATCGLERMVAGRRYVFFMQRHDVGLTASSCGGTGPATPAFLDEVEAVTGAGTSFGGVPPGLSEGEVARLRAALSELTLWP